jgi:amino-acid N-acetyltransferase
MNKAEQILTLIEPFVRKGNILPRSKTQIEQNIDDFILLFDKGDVIACAGLKDCKERGMGEIYTLAVALEKQHMGLSAKLLRAIMHKAKSRGFNRLFALTKHNANWFVKHQFQSMKISELPKARQALFDYQRNSLIFFKDVN